MRARGVFCGVLCSMAFHPVVAVPASTQPASVQVFTTAHLPALRRLDRATQVWVLDAMETPLNSLAFPYPGSEEAARRQAVSVINSPRGQVALDALRRTAQAVALAWQSGIEKLPAVLVDEHYVVYGEYDVQVALERVADYRKKRVRDERSRKERTREGVSAERKISHVP